MALAVFFYRLDTSDKSSELITFQFRLSKLFDERGKMNVMPHSLPDDRSIKNGNCSKCCICCLHRFALRMRGGRLMSGQAKMTRTLPPRSFKVKTLSASFHHCHLFSICWLWKVKQDFALAFYRHSSVAILSILPETNSSCVLHTGPIEMILFLTGCHDLLFNEKPNGPWTPQPMAPLQDGRAAVFLM